MTTNQDFPIEARHFTKHFTGGAAVDDVSFTVARGRVVGLLGPNGAGKTTTICMLLGLSAPDGGDSLIQGCPYAELRSPLRTVGAVLHIGGLHPSRTGRAHLRISAAQAGVPESRLAEVLAEVGMRQRIALAAALLGSPDILVLDEPAKGLDPRYFCGILAADHRQTENWPHRSSGQAAANAG